MLEHKKNLSQIPNPNLIQEGIILREKISQK